MENERIRFIGNVHVGVDLKVDELRQFYDAVIFATGAERDRSLRIPGEELRGSYGAADFVAFYDSHPDREQTWDLSGQRSVAVIGVGNVGLDVARMLARTADELLSTDIPPHVHEVLAELGRHRRAHVRPPRPGAGQVHPGRAARAGPLAQRPGRGRARRAWSSTPESQASLSRSKSLRMVVDVLSDWAMRDPEPGPHRRIHLHFLENPIEILGDGRRRGRAAHRAAGTDRRRHRPRHRRVHRLGRAGGLPGGRLPLRGDRGPAVRHPPDGAAERRRPGARPGRRAAARACTRPAGSSAARSG